LTYPSRKYKFKILFYAIGMFILVTGIEGGMDDANAMNKQWLQNARKVSIQFISSI